ncbi:hypothetical protein MYU51_006999 [Penicillium brevicompactum]
MEVEWEKEGAESWALPDYGPPRPHSLDQADLRTAYGESDDEDDRYNSERFEEQSYVPDPLGSSTELTFSLGSAHAATSLSFDDPEAQAGKREVLRQLVANRAQGSSQGESLFKVGQYGTPKGKSDLPLRGKPQENRTQKSATRGLHNRGQISSNDDFAKAKWRRGGPADAIFRLPCEYKEFQNRIAQAPGGALSHADFLRQLMQETGAYVRISVKNPKLIEIWGRESQVLAAQKMAQHYVNETSQPNRPDKSKIWTKISAHSNVKVASEKVKEFEHAKMQGLRKAPAIPTYCMYLFLWPEEGPSLSHCLVTHRQQLDDMRASHDVHLYTVPGNYDYIFLGGTNEESLYQVAEKLRDLWHGLYLQCETEIKLFLVAPPAASIMRMSIIMDRVGDYSKAFLNGEKLPREQALAWGPKVQGFVEGNKEVIQTNLEKALELVLNMSGELHMRAKFGSFFLGEYKKPETGYTYTFEEFRDMLRLKNVEGRLLPGISLPQETIFKRIKDAQDLLAPWGGIPLESLMSIKPKHSASFDYQVGGDAIIRVEVSFSQPLGISEFEANRARIFKPQKKGTHDGLMKPMQISMIDFERADWQFEVKAFTLYQGDEFHNDLEKFKQSIRYTWNPSASSIGSAPKRKTQFTRGVPVTRFVEKSAIELNVIDTPYVFELARYDLYKNVNREWTNAKVSWGGSIFNPEWDHTLTEQADKIERGETPHIGGLSTFFPAPQNVIDKAMASWDEDEAKKASDEAKEVGDEAKEASGEVKQKDEDEVKKKAELEARRIEAEIRIRKHHETEQLKIFMSKVQTLARMLGSPEPDMGEFLDMDIGTLF